MEAKEILAITKCGDLFPYGEEQVKVKYKELAKEWHPDINLDSEASAVFAKITELYQRALELLAQKQWEKTNFLFLLKEDGKKVALNYDTCFDFELGTCYVTKTKVVYVFDRGKEKYYQNAIRRVRGFLFADRKMEQVFRKSLPELYQNFKTKQGEYVIVFCKAEGVYPLKSVIAYFDGKMEDRHAAWVISRLYNLACYLKYSGLVHNGITIKNCFLSPEDHSILLLGGWWYATREGEEMLGTTKDIFSVMSVAAKSSKKSSSLTDLESIKLLGRQLLGEGNCRKLALEDSLPKPFVEFLICGSGADSYKEFAKWDRALLDAYGKRTFIPMKLHHVYDKNRYDKKRKEG